MTPTYLQVALTGVLALSALAAVLVTLTRDAVHKRFRGPVLTLRGGDRGVHPGRSKVRHGRALSAHDESWTATSDVVCFDDAIAPGGGPGAVSYRECYVRLRVHAAPRRDAARGVRVFLLHVERPPASTRGAVPDYLIKWSGPLDCAEDVDIAAGTFRRLDVLRHRWTCDSNGMQRDLFLTPGLRRSQNVGDDPSPSARNRLDQAGTYSLIILVSAENADPTSWRFSFEHRGGPIDETHDLATCIRNPMVERLKGGWDVPVRSPSPDKASDPPPAHHWSR